MGPLAAVRQGRRRLGGRPVQRHRHVHGNPFNFQGLDFRTGWTVGAGVEWAIWEYWSVKLEYDYYDFGRGTVQMSDNVLVLSGPVDVKQTVQSVRLGLNFHVW